MRYAQTLSARAVKDLDALDNKTKKRMLDRIVELADAPYDPRLSVKLTNQGGLRRSRVAGWRIIFLVDDNAKTLSVGDDRAPWAGLQARVKQAYEKNRPNRLRAEAIKGRRNRFHGYTADRDWSNAVVGLTGPSRVSEPFGMRQRA